jgi:asparagine synthase (glutamine-hydrolysing)
VSGLVGIYNLDGRSVDRGDVERMVVMLAHRGPDGTGIWNKESIGLGHRMLWTTPESLHERLPLVSQTGDLVLTADARIDNRDELISRLGLTDHPSGEIADSQLILAAYEKWGEDCAEKLLGDFAFAIWDARRQRLFCARDPMGVKPFYYFHSGRVFAFASEIKAVLCLEEVPRKLNEVKVADCLIPIFNDQISTYYKDIVRLPPAHSMTVGSGGVRTKSYWSLDPTRELRLGSDEEYEEAFRELFTEAIRCRLRSAFPVGSTLSGGLDSSSIACTADKLLAANGGQRLHTFSAIFPSVAEEDPRIDERPFIEAVLATGNFQPHYVRADCCKPLADVAWHKDEVLAIPNWYMVSPLFRTAQEHGVRVLLSGFGGDEVVSYGYEHLDELARTGGWADFGREARDLSQRFGGKPLYHLRRRGFPYLTELARKWHWRAFAKQMGEVAGQFALSRQRIFLEAVLKPLVPQLLWRAWQLVCGHAQAKSGVWGLNNAIKPDFAQRINLTERVKAFETKRPISTDHLREQHVLGLASGDVQYPLGRFDQAATTFALEQRYPFFDRRFMEFCLALPFEQKLRQGWTRVIFRRAMEKVLPPKVQWRTDKGNLRLNVRRRLLEERETLDAVILHDPGVIERYVDVPALRAAYRRYLSQPVPSISEEDLFTIFLSVNLALWLRQSGLSPVNE